MNKKSKHMSRHTVEWQPNVPYICINKLVVEIDCVYFECVFFCVSVCTYGACVCVCAYIERIWGYNIKETQS